jgi:hypothetical protein
MSSWLFSEMWMFCHMIFGHLWCPAACSAKCRRFVQNSLTSQNLFSLFSLFFYWFDSLFPFPMVKGASGIIGGRLA